MKLNLSLEGKLLASVSVVPFAENNDYYLKAFRRLLVLRHEKKLRNTKKEPQFFVEKTDNAQKN